MAQQEAIKEAHARVYEWEATDERGKHKSSEQIEHEIDETRYDMDRTMNEIGRRFNPRNFFDHVLDYFRDKQNRERVTDFARDVGRASLESARHNPGPLFLIGGGVAWLLMSERRGHDGRRMYDVPGHYVDTRTGEPYPTERETGEHLYQTEEDQGEHGMAKKAKDAFGSAKAVGGRAGAGAKEMGAGAAQSAKGAFARTGEKAREQARAQASRLRHGAQHGASSIGEAGRRRASEGVDRLGELMREYPLAAGLGVMALGVFAGGLMPRTGAEDQTLGESSDTAKERVGETAWNAEEHAETAARQAGETAGKSSESKGLHEEQLSEKARSTLSEAAQSAKPETQKSSSQS
ncbi:MAG: DUF3618 domain-containing protein [Chitinivibrionales bacterium]|nr:DUF3618 domain-containing protein [Chitinivibrionales bacterium]MBD3355564.1 DUF3618 domain-containing protein [Chitinivibrionales bacterium]